MTLPPHAFTLLIASSSVNWKRSVNVECHCYYRSESKIFSSSTFIHQKFKQYLWFGKKFVGSSKYIITKIECWPVFKQDPDFLRFICQEFSQMKVKFLLETGLSWTKCSRIHEHLYRYAVKRQIIAATNVLTLLTLYGPNSFLLTT